MKVSKSFLLTVKNIRHVSLSDRVTVQVISVLSVISTLTTLLTFLIVFSSDQSWDDIRDYVLHWMTDNNIDVDATRKVVSALRWMSSHSSLMNSIFILLNIIHCIFSTLLYFGSSPPKAKYRVPWLVSHMLVIILTTIIFICWTFVTFFIDLLVTIVCPVLSGLVLGVSILLWRLVHTIHTSQHGHNHNNGLCHKAKLTEMS